VPSKLEQLKQYTVVVADTGEIHAIERYRPQDCTTNPSLILRAAEQPEYRSFVEESLGWALARQSEAGRVTEAAIDKLAVRIGTELTRLVPGYVSTEVDARLSFDREGMIRKANRLIELYGAEGVGPDRVLIKLASTWEGIRAAETLERQGIRCNLTLVFSLAQAVASAEAGAFLISPFVGRITDWHKKTTGRESFPPEEDPGVRSVRQIYRHFKAKGYNTVVMGASFRSAAQVEALAGCDRLTVSPKLLAELDADSGELHRELSPDASTNEAMDASPVDEPSFRWALQEDLMAQEKLAEGIRLFHRDYLALQGLLAERLTKRASAAG